jgi:predicted RNA binding protein YcfA (HicA-like mRNA interferase family)
MPRKIRDLVAELERAGWMQTGGGKGSHRQFAHPRSRRKSFPAERAVQTRIPIRRSWSNKLCSKCENEDRLLEVCAMERRGSSFHRALSGLFIGGFESPAVSSIPLRVTALMNKRFTASSRAWSSRKLRKVKRHVARYRKNRRSLPCQWQSEAIAAVALARAIGTMWWKRWGDLRHRPLA